MKLQTIIITFLLLWSSNLYGQDLEPIPSGMIYNLEGKVDESGKQGFGLRIRTREPYDCENPEIMHKTSVKGNKINISVRGVKISENCYGKMNSASTYIDLLDLEPGEYQIRPVVHKHILKAELLVTETGYIFRSDEDPVLVLIQNRSLNRIPEGIIWGSCSFNKEDRNAAGKFMAELEEAGTKRVKLPLGNYGEFYVHSIEEFSEITDGDETQTSFYFQFNGDFGIIREIASQYREKVQIEVKDLKGNHLRDLPE